VAYDTEAHEFVYSFYAKGWSKARALPEIRKVYPGFSGSTWDEWEKKFNWKERRALADARLREFEDRVHSVGLVLLGELDDIRKRLYERLRNGASDNQTVYAYTSVVKRMAELSHAYLSGKDKERVTTEVLGAAIEALLVKLQEIKALKEPLKRHAAEIGAAVSEVAQEFGRQA